MDGYCTQFSLNVVTKTKEAWYSKFLMQVSVIIPTFNRAHTILRALKSVLTQERVASEIFVIDDGSTDETRSLIESTCQKEPNVQYLFQPNQGPSAARNLGIRKSRAPYVAFLDSDDEWLPGKLGAQLQFFESYPNFLICQTEEIWIRNGRRVNPMKKHKKFGGLIFEACLPLSIVSPSCVMMRRPFFDQVGLFDETFPACEDYELWLRTSARFPIGLMEQPYVMKYGGHSDQLSRTLPVMDQFRIRALLKLLESDFLTADQQKMVASELVRKAKIVGQGSLKRGKKDDAAYYEGLVKTFNGHHD